MKARLTYQTEYECWRSQFPHVVRIRYPLQTSHGMVGKKQHSVPSRADMTIWLKNNGIYSARTFGLNSMVLVDKKWQEFAFKQQEHAVLFSLTWQELIKAR